MKTRLFFYFFLTLVLLGSCRKKDEILTNNSISYDTIKPLDYFPAFPGSYWTYTNNYTLKVAYQYKMFIFGLNSGDPMFYDTLILPKLESTNVFTSYDDNGFVKGYELTAPSGVTYIPDPVYKCILSTKEDSIFVYGPSMQGHTPMAKTIKVDTSIYIGAMKYENVLITIHWDNAAISAGLGNSPEECASLREYYAKGVGLIKREHRYIPNDTIFTTDFELVDYHINN
jgi:hypothetical protein